MSDITNYCCVCRKEITGGWFHGTGMICSPECSRVMAKARELAGGEGAPVYMTMIGAARQALAQQVVDPQEGAA